MLCFVQYTYVGQYGTETAALSLLKKWLGALLLVIIVITYWASGMTIVNLFEDSDISLQFQYKLYCKGYLIVT